MRHSNLQILAAGCIGIVLGAIFAWRSNDVFLGLPAAIMVAVAAAWFLKPVGQR